jgi:hypothetical protein
MANVINAADLGAVVVATSWGGFIATKGEVSAESTSEQGALRILLKKLTVQPAAPPVVKAVAPAATAAPPVATAPASGFTAEEQAILLLTGHLKQEAVYYDGKDGKTHVGLPRSFSFNAQKRLRWMKPAERQAELGAWCLARNVPNFFASLATPTAEQIATAKIYCRQGAAQVPAKPAAPVTAPPVQAAAPVVQAAPVDQAAMIAAIVAQVMAAMNAAK